MSCLFFDSLRNPNKSEAQVGFPKSQTLNLSGLRLSQDFRLVRFRLQVQALQPRDFQAFKMLCEQLRV